MKENGAGKSDRGVFLSLPFLPKPWRSHPPGTPDGAAPPILFPCFFWIREALGPGNACPALCGFTVAANPAPEGAVFCTSSNMNRVSRTV